MSTLPPPNDLPEQDLLPEPGVHLERERITLTATQLKAVRMENAQGGYAFTATELAELLNLPFSKATVSRIRDGQDFYVQNKNVREMYPNPAIAAEMVHVFQDMVERIADERLEGIEAMEAGVRDRIFALFSREDLRFRIGDAAQERLEQLAGHPDLRKKGWIRRVAFHASEHILRQVFSEAAQQPQS